MENPAAARDAPLMVVVAEDEFLIRIAAADALEEVGLSVAEASNAEQALKRIEQDPKRVKVLFTDIHMPGPMNGVELANRVHSIWPWIKVVIVSGKHEPHLSDVPPGTVFMRKPYDLDRVVKQVRGWMTDAG